MTNEDKDGKTAARELATRLPGWMVWYGEHTRRYWATPRGKAAARGVLAEADTPEELEDIVRQMMGAAPRPEAPAAETRAPEPVDGREMIQGSETVRSPQNPAEPKHSREPVGARNARD
ncbi:hypothetical protein [Sphaerisporangium aureirubrum]|uniref:Uncharacterized protein n=1 Tax=Sphaerisporangium aureirubrum TaxID=1544736 RepID=A0ABW1NBI0_9ACTN